MNMKKFGLSLAFAAIFGLAACGSDSDSTSANDSSSEEPVVEKDKASSSSQKDAKSSSSQKEAKSSSSNDDEPASADDSAKSSSSSNGDSGSAQDSDLGEQNSPHYFGFTGCGFSIDDEEWSFSVNYSFMVLNTRTEFKYIVNGDTIVKTESEIDSHNSCKSKVNQLCETEECQAEFEETGRGAYRKPLNNVTDYIYCTDDGIAVLEQETIYVIGESAASRESVFEDAKDECGDIQYDIDEDNQ